LQLEELKECMSVQELKSTLRNMPRTLDAIFRRILSNIRPCHRERAKTVLLWLTLSFRTLYVEEIEDVLAVNPTNKADPDSDMAFDPDSRLQNGQDEIFSICSSLVKVERDPKTKRTTIQLAHLSMKEYLLSNRYQSEPSSTWLSCIQAGPSHCSIARTSLSYLLYFERGDFFELNKLEDFPLARYAAQFWFEHARLAGDVTGPLDTQMQGLFGHHKEAFANWIRLFNPDVPQEEPKIRKKSREVRSPWYYASLLGLNNLIQPLLASVSDINAPVGFAGNALQAASFRGLDETVALLLALGADVNARASSDRHDALHAASYSGHTQVVRTLLEAGADADSCGGLYGYALQAAAYNGHEETVRLLLDKAASVNAVGGHWGTALIAASWSGFSGVVKLLLQRHAEVNLMAENFGTALQAASCDGQETVVDVLLEAGADVKLVAGGPEWFGTALQAAASSGFESIARKLIDRGAGVNARGGKYGTPLIAAAAMGQESMVQFLLNEGADLHAEIEGKEYKNAWEATDRQNLVKQRLRDWMRSHLP